MIGAFLDWLRHSRRKNVSAVAQAAGRRGEDLAHRYLRQKGFVIVARNYRLPSGDGEADLIAWDGENLVIAEVKSRESAEYGPPERAISPEKLGHMTRVARAYARKTNTPWDRIRFDVVTVILKNPAEIAHFHGVRSGQPDYSRSRETI
ncbi:MAG TPA: YraN family protein [Bryobacteraceae bacterium]|jgi:putative endonuclease